MSRRGEEGISLIELLVAMFILFVVVAAISATMNGALRVVQLARATSVATSLTAEELELVRAVDATVLTTGRTTRTAVLGPVTYTITRDAEWVGIDSPAASCTAAGGDIDVLRVTVVVSWGGLVPGETIGETLLAPNIGAYDPFAGHLLATVIDSRTNVVPGQQVWLRAPDGSVTFKITTADGCVVFDHIVAGIYDVWVNTPDKVDEASVQLSEQTATVNIASTTNVTFVYDRSSDLEATLQGAEATAQLPIGLDVVLRNTALQPTGLATVPGAGPVRLIPDRFPFSDGYSAWASYADCLDADPQVHGLPRVLFDVVPGATTARTIDMPSLRIDLRQWDPLLDDANGDGLPNPGEYRIPPPRLILADHPDEAGGCTSVPTLLLGVSDAQGFLRVAMPFGNWVLSWDFDGDGDVDGADQAAIATQSGDNPDVLLDLPSIYDLAFEVGGV